jgi:hypothetical protein
MEYSVRFSPSQCHISIWIMYTNGQQLGDGNWGYGVAYSSTVLPHPNSKRSRLDHWTRWAHYYGGIHTVDRDRAWHFVFSGL